MSSHGTRGAFITFEGPEGSGKSTQAVRLAERLRGAGHVVTLTREPGGTKAGERIRSVLLDPDVDGMQPVTESLLFCAARAELVHRVIRPALRSGGVVLCDRFADATVVYQGHGRGVDPSWLHALNDAATQGVRPHLTLLLDLAVETGLERRRLDGDWNRMDAADIAFHRRVRDGYLALAHEDPARWAVVDATLAVDELSGVIARVVADRLGLP